MTEELEMFWIVWSPDGSNPAYRHIAYDQAVAEAERLASKYPGSEFYVMAAQSMRVIQTMRKVEFTQSMPF